MTLQELEAKTTRAKELAHNLELLEAADPHGPNKITLKCQHWNTGDDFLTTDLLINIYREGHARVLRLMKEQLEIILQ